MKKLSILVIGLVFGFGVFQVSGQNKISAEKFITVKLLFPKEANEKIVKELNVPISTNLEKVGLLKNGFIDIVTIDKNIVFEPLSGNLLTLHCPECLLTSEYSYIAVAKFINENESEVSLRLSFANQKRCDNFTQFRVDHDKPNNIKLRCGMKVIAHYNQIVDDQK